MSFQFQINLDHISPYEFLAHEGLSSPQWHLGGAFVYDKVLNSFAKNLNSLIRGAIKIASVEGAPANRWSLDWFDQYTLMPPMKVEQVMMDYAALNIPLTLCFDNPFLGEAICSDSVGNSLMLLLQKHNPTKLNAVSVASVVLAKYIAKKFPNIRRIAHVNRTVSDKAQGNWEHYRTLAKEFDRVCIHLDDLSDPVLLGKELLDRNRYELTVNDTCLTKCPLRYAHMKALDSIAREPLDVNGLAFRHQLLIKAGCEEVSYPGKPSLQMTHQMLEAYSALGFRHFRVQAESLRNEMSLLYDAAYYMLTKNLDNMPKRQILLTSTLMKMTSESTKASSGFEDFHLRRFL